MPRSQAPPASPAKPERPRRWGLHASLAGSCEVTRSATEDEYDADDLRHDLWIDEVRLCAPGEVGNLAVSFEPKAGMKVHVVSARYSTGDSFHREEGLMEIVAAYEDEKFARRAKAAMESAGEDHSLALFEPDGTLTRVGNPGSGYFESLDSVEIHLATVAPAPAPRSSGARRRS